MFKEMYELKSWGIFSLQVWGRNNDLFYKVLEFMDNEHKHQMKMPNKNIMKTWMVLYTE